MNYQPNHPLDPEAQSDAKQAQRTHDLERGQAIVLIAFIMVALIGMLGLSVDGGGLLFLYRDARNATDATTLAAAYARCTGGAIEDGYTTATDNGFNNNETDNFVKIISPPESGTGAGDPDYINVQIKAFKPSYFIQVVFPEPLWVTTEATGFCRRPFDSSTVGAIFGLADVCSTGGPAVELSGSSQHIEGDVYSNEDTKMTGSSMTVDGSMGTVGGFEPTNNFDDKVVVLPPGVADDNGSVRGNPYSWVDIADYRPGGIIFDALDAWNPTQVHHITSDWDPNNSSPISGFYMVEGDVTLRQISVDNSIGLTVIATGQIRVISPNSEMVYYKPLLTLNDNDIPSIGFLFYSEFGVRPSCSSSNDAIDYSTNHSATTGVIYAPNGGISGSFASGFYKGALIGWRVSLSGADTDIIRDPSLFPPQPPRVSIAD